MEQEETQKMVFEMKMLESKLKQLDQQMGLLEQSLAETEKLEESLDDFKKAGKGDAIVPIGMGIFAHGKIEDTSKAIVSIGAGLAVEKSIEETKLSISKRKDKMRRARVEITNQINMVLEEISEIDSRMKGAAHVHGPGCDHED